MAIAPRLAPLAPLPSAGLEDAIPLDLEQADVVPTEDGGVTVDFDGPPAAVDPVIPFDGDLSLLFTDQELSRLGNELIEIVKQDDSSRKEWKDTYAKGLELLGLKYEQRTQPWENACGAFHPVLLESVIRFNAQAMMDIFPGAGPVKTKIVGRITDEKERQAGRVQTDMNWLTSEKIRGYRSETDMMLFNLPLAGTTFRKFGFNTDTKLPWAEYVLGEHVIIPYTASSLESSDRFTVALDKTKNWLEAKMAKGVYRTFTITDGIAQTSVITQEKDRIEGRSNSTPGRDGLHRIYEVNIDYFFKEDATNTTGLPVPYLVTLHNDTTKVLSIRRNWKENDPAMQRQVNLVQHKYMPGFGPYGIGLINILGGLTESATSILRQLVDAGTLSNLPAGYKTKSARVTDDSTPIGPGEWRDVDVGMDTLAQSFFALPYGEPSTVLAALLGQIVDEARRIGSVADMKITDMTGQNMPVGTTLAIIERSMKVMSAVQQRLYESFKNEFKVLAEIVKDFMGDIPYPFELDARDTGATRATDMDDKVDVIPVADPNATTMAQRIMVLQAIIQLTQTAPQIYNLKNVHRDMIAVLGSDKADYYIPPDEEVQPRDPVTENMDLLTSKPVRAGIAQDHEAHIKVHMSAVEDPKIQALMNNNPAAPAIIAATSAHIQEHLAFQYRAQIEELLGVPLPPPGEPLPEDVEYELSRLAAAAAQKLLDKNKAEAEQQRILEAMEDPVIQNERRGLDIKQDSVDNKFEIDRLKIADKAEERRLEALLTIFKEMSETERSTLAVEIQKGIAADDKMLRTAEIAADLGQGMMGEIGKLFAKRIDADARKDRTNG